MSAVLEFPVRSTPLREDEQRSLERLMSNIQGEDHRRLAEIIDVRVEMVEKKVDVVADDVKDLSRVVHELVGRLAGPRETQPDTIIGLLNRQPWLIPVMLVLGAAMFGSTAFLAFLERG
jgi:hypothetical protein